MKKAGYLLVWGLLVLIAVFSLSIGCVSNGNPASNNGKSSDNLPDIYTAPIGGFDEKVIRIGANTVYSINYTFYSQDWEGGSVDYQMSHDGQNFTPSDPVNVTISPSHFVAGPHKEYNSLVTISTGAAFAENTRLSLAVRLQDNLKHYANDQFQIFSDKKAIPPGLGIISTSSMSVGNQTLTVRRGETQRVNVSFYQGQAGLEQVSYSLSDTPLDVTITPPEFVATNNVIKFPSVLSVSAGPTTNPGKYNFYLNVTRTGSHSDLQYSQYKFTVNVP